MDFLVLSAAATWVPEPDDELTERHWSYMDRFADGMTARGPTLSSDRVTWTGSMHVVSLESVDEVAAFVADEPYHLAGLFESHRTWGFANLIGRTMWDHPRRPDEPYFLIVGSSAPVDVPAEQLLMSGALRTLDGGLAGFAAAVQLPDRSALGGLDDFGVEVLDWEPGGRR